MAHLTPYHLDISEDTIATIKARVASYPWHEMPDDGGWDYGVNLDYMKEICAYWVEEFDWYKQQEAINRFNQFTAPVDGVALHFIHEKGSGPNHAHMRVNY